MGDTAVGKPPPRSAEASAASASLPARSLPARSATTRANHTFSPPFCFTETNTRDQVIDGEEEEAHQETKIKIVKL